MLGQFSAGGCFASLDFTRGEAEVQLQMLDRGGTTLVYERSNSRRASRGSSVAMRAGFDPAMLGLGGHGRACKLSGGTWQAHLFDTVGGASTDARPRLGAVILTPAGVALP